MGFKLEHTVLKESKSTKPDGLSKLLQKEVTLFGSFFGNKKKEDFYAELSVLLNAGINLREGLALLKENQKKEKLRSFFCSMEDALISGKSFYEILQDKKEFTEYEYYSIKIGEETGNLTRITEELGKFYARKNEQRRSLMNALTYPIIILITAVLVVVFMLRMVVPMFEDIFKQNKVELPAITKMIINASNFIRDYGWLVLLLLFSIIILRKTFSKKRWFKRNKDYLLLRIPYVGQFIKTVYLAQFTQAVSLLTSSKVPMLNSIQMVKKMIGFVPLQEALTTVENGVLKGLSLNESLKGNKIFDNKMISLIKVAEETNQTEYIFERLNELYSVEVQQKSKLLSTLMEPLIIVVVGIFVGVILVSMYLPMFKLSSVLG
ncbi:general secretion pathway protein GspF [Zobellia sp. OII3]|uniref:type II secretion system F family protein n=1 Tax=Zobellia sp. OII3 TaxID=2034520 RepID=UPI000B52EACB|nr:type II secretion system F family protein [Zobellia sp. OII3]OWW23500.1 general secretion pathway protein GspF [Zobellia sp. OII3]